MNSNFLTLNLKDFAKGLFVSVLTAVITIVQTSLRAGILTFDWKVIGTAALAAGIAYLSKNLLTNSSGQIAKTEVADMPPDSKIK